MIPTIEDIVADLLAGTMTKEQAVHWLYQHMENADLRDQFAAQAVQGLLANSGGPVQQNGMTGWNFTNCTPQNVAALAYEMANEMLEERSK